jgi:hypothetical protein
MSLLDLLRDVARVDVPASHPEVLVLTALAVRA